MEKNVESWRCFLSERARIRRFIHARISNPEDVADLVQDVGVLVLAHDNPPLGEPAFRAWLFSIARNVVFRHWRTSKRQNALLTPTDFAVDEPCGNDESPEDAIIRSQSVSETLAMMDPAARALLTARYVYGKSFLEIADESRESSATVRMRVMRLRDKMNP